MNSSPIRPARSLKNLLPTAFFFCGCTPAARSFSAFSASFFAFSSLYTPKPMEDRKLKKMLMPQVTGRVLSSECRYSVSSRVSWMPFFCAVSLTSFAPASTIMMASFVPAR